MRQTTEPTTTKEWEASFHDMADLAGWHQRRANRAEAELRELQEALRDIEAMYRWDKDTKPWIDRARRALAASSEEPE